MALDFTNLSARPSDGRHLTAQQTRTIERYLRKLQTAMNMPQWRVYVAKDLPPEDTLLMIEPTDGTRVAMLYVAETWWDRCSEDKRVDLCHEMIHLLHHDQEEVIRTFIHNNGDVASYVMELIWERFKIETERLVDELSVLVAPSMPVWR